MTTCNDLLILHRFRQIHEICKNKERNEYLKKLKIQNKIKKPKKLKTKRKYCVKKRNLNLFQSSELWL